jgi:hypothetical protein
MGFWRGGALMAGSSKTFESGKFLVKKLAAVLLFAAGVSGFSCQDKGGEQQPVPTPTPTAVSTATPITGPGSSGDPNDIKHPQGAIRIDYTVGLDCLTPIPCDQRRQVRVQVSQQVLDCSKFNFTSLSGEAQKLAQAQMALIQCPKDAPCSIRNSFYTYYEQDCISTRLFNAYVRIVGYVVCATPGSKDSTYKGITLPGTMTQPWDNAEPAEWEGNTDEAHMISISGLGWPGNGHGLVLACPYNELVRIVYREAVVPGSAPDYNAVVDRARAQAEVVSKLFTCEGDCKPKEPFAPAFIKWNSFDGHVVVEVYFWVRCQKWL